MIAINTAIYGPQGNIGLGFALPINRAKGMLDEFAKTGKITRPVLGVSVLPVSGDLAQMLNLPSEGGLLIQRVERGSPAQQYGLKRADAARDRGQLPDRNRRGFNRSDRRPAGGRKRLVNESDEPKARRGLRWS